MLHALQNNLPCGMHPSWRALQDRYLQWGYEAHFWFIHSHEHRGVVQQDQCILALWRDIPSVAPLRVPETINTTGGPWTAHNMLSPTGIPRAAWIQEEWRPRGDYPDWVVEPAAPCLLMGETCKRRMLIFSPDGCLPDSVGALIATDREVRRMLGDELAKAKGVPPKWI